MELGFASEHQRKRLRIGQPAAAPCLRTPFADAAGVIRSVGSEASGTWKVVHRSFDEYGLVNGFPYVTDNEDPNFGTRPQFLGDTTEAALLAVPVFYAGGEWDADAQVYVMGGRFYEPYSGRWITDLGGENGYKFGDNNPTRDRTIGDTVYAGMFADYSYYVSPLNNDPGAGGVAFGVGKALGWTGFVVGSAGAGLIGGAAAITAGAQVAGTTVGTYLGTQAVIAGLETGIEYGASSYFGSDMSAGATLATFGKNFAVNSLTGGIGGAATTAGRVGLFFGRQAIEIGADTALDVARGNDFTTSLLVNTAGSLLGEAAGRAIGAGARAFHRNFEFSFDTSSALAPNTFVGFVRPPFNLQRRAPRNPAAAVLDDFAESHGASVRSRLISPEEQIGINREVGDLRELEELAELQARYPNASILRKKTLFDANRNPVIDARDKIGRQLDFVVVENGRVIDVVETTGLNVPKAKQLDRERRIRADGGQFVIGENDQLIQVPYLSRVSRRD